MALTPEDALAEIVALTAANTTPQLTEDDLVRLVSRASFTSNQVVTYPYINAAVARGWMIRAGYGVALHNKTIDGSKFDQDSFSKKALAMASLYQSMAAEDALTETQTAGNLSGGFTLDTTDRYANGYPAYWTADRIELQEEWQPLVDWIHNVH